MIYATLVKHKRRSPAVTDIYMEQFKLSAISPNITNYDPAIFEGLLNIK